MWSDSCTIIRRLVSRRCYLLCTPRLTPPAPAMVLWSDQFSARPPSSPPLLRSSSLHPYGNLVHQSGDRTSRKNLRTLHRFPGGTTGSTCSHDVSNLPQGSFRAALANDDESR